MPHLDLIRWFYGKDIFIDMISAVVILFIFLFAFKCARMNKENKKVLGFSVAMFLLFLSYLFELLTHLRIYYTDIEKEMIGAIVMSYQTVKISSLPLLIGVFGSRFLMMIGLYLLYSLYMKKQTKVNFLFIAYLLLAVTYLSYFESFIYNLTCFIILALVIITYFIIYNEEKNYKTKLIGYSFIILLISHGILVFFSFYPYLYIISEIIHLSAFIVLLFTFIKVLIDGKKTR
jgi:hypothetical protein